MHRINFVSAGILLVLGLLFLMAPVASAERGGFEKDCTGFARDPRLRALWSDPSGMPQHASSLTAAVPRLSLQGTALAMRAAQTEPTAASLESIFGVSPYGPREIVETAFYQESRAVAFSSQVIATVAHALTLDRVDIQSKKQKKMKSTVPLRVAQMTVEVHGDAAEKAVTAHIAHQNEPYDLALLQTPPNAMLRPLPYRAVLSYGTGDPARPSGGLEAGDCVAAIVPVRDAAYDDTGAHRLAVGKVLAKVPVAVNSMTQTKLNINMFTTDVDVQPGDSGSPILALRTGAPVLVGLVAATMYPAATFTYVTRIDPLIAFAQALQQELKHSQNRSYVSEKSSPIPTRATR